MNPRFRKLALGAIAIALTALAISSKASLRIRSDSSPSANPEAITSSQRTALATSMVAAQTPTQIEITGSGHTQADETGTLYNGNADLVLNGETHQVVVTVTLASPFTAAADGSQVASSSHVLDFGNGDTIKTSERLVISTSPNSDRPMLSAALAITSGTGVYANVHGSLTLSGSVNGEPQAADWNLNGTIAN